MFPQNQRELSYYYGRVSLALIVYTAVVQGLASISYLPYYLGNYDLFFSDWYYYLIDPLVFYPAGLLIFWVMLGNFPTPRLVRAKAPSPGQICSCIAVSLGLLYAASMLTELLLANTETVDYANEAVAEEPLFFAVLCTVIIAPICEEYIFRRLLMDRLLFLGDWSAIVLSSLFFGLFHTNLYQFLYAFAVGLVLGYVRIMTGSMRWNILLHLFINLFCGVLIGYLPSEEWIDALLGLVILGCICYSAYYLVREKPWRNFYPGPTQCSAGEKRRACLTNVTFWICILVHLGLSVYYICV
ncbi:MAG: lysostaphin resistance A-like protein [Candidatus Onthomonas sp.]